MRLCRLAGVEPSILLHPLDFLGADDVDALGFFPGMAMTGDRKRAVVGRLPARAQPAVPGRADGRARRSRSRHAGGLAVKPSADATPVLERV